MRGSTDRSAPIGVFDSGLGGLTVAHAIMRQLPAESIIYFGDTARVPYGPKSPDTVRRYSHEIAAWLLDQGVKAIVVACNTATAHALPMLERELDVPVIGVVEPGARAAVAASHSGRIGVIATAGTIRSGAYVRAIQAEAPDAIVAARACPLLVPLVEEGWTEHEATRAIAREYLTPFMNGEVDTLVLGCTHYPAAQAAHRRDRRPGRPAHRQRRGDGARHSSDARRALARRQLGGGRATGSSPPTTRSSS